MAKHPDAKPKAVAEAVSAALKVKVSPNYVSIIKSSSLKKKKVGPKTGKGSGEITKAACALLRVCGGNVITAINELERIGDIIKAVS